MPGEKPSDDKEEAASDVKSQGGEAEVVEKEVSKDSKKEPDKEAEAA